MSISVDFFDTSRHGGLRPPTPPTPESSKVATKKSKSKAPAKKPAAKKVVARKTAAPKAPATGSLSSIIKSSYLKRMGG